MTEDRGAAAVARIRDSAGFRAAMAHLAEGHARIVEETIRLQQIPAPYRGEAEKGRAFAAMLAQAGLPEVTTDAEGNVLALRRGRGSNRGLVALVSHLDTVFPADTDLTIRREGTRIVAPGIADDTHGLAVQLGLVRALEAAGIATERDVLFVGSVGEEGLGDLRGVKHLMGQGEFRDRIETFVALDGGQPDRLVTTAVGSRRHEILFRGPGGHSYGAFGTVNPVYALARALAAFAQTEAPPGATYSIGLIGGGTSINAIPREAWCQADLRAADPDALAALEVRLTACLEEAVAHENAARATATGPITLEARRVGDRPSGRTPDDAEVVGIARAAIAAAGWTPDLTASSTDANVAISLGVPAVTVASGIGGRAHSLDEYLDVEPTASLRQIGIALTVLLATAGLAGA
jgi:tripeptide aminopeptidase